jgi:hypothetical protein
MLKSFNVMYEVSKEITFRVGKLPYRLVQEMARFVRKLNIAYVIIMYIGVRLTLCRGLATGLMGD